ncbi:MAG TPA: PQQ-dependent sugar dehydrogenase [Opitutaceae bacterium]|nr:PQQ-dependent sugar dehydrogenase [Opitutaceae bacterium]
MRATLLLLLVSTPALAAIPPKGRDAGTLYTEYCAGCHGAQFEGGKGPSLITGHWTHGGDDESLMRTILQGYPGNGMPGFAQTINQAEARALVDYLHEVATHAVDPRPGRDRPLPAGVQHSEVENYRLVSIAEGLDVPWSLTFLPDGRMLVTERVGRLRIIQNGHLLPEPVAGVPKVVVHDEAGLMSVVASPDYARDGWIYLTFSDPGEGDTAMVKIIRGRLRDNALVDQQTIFSVPKAQYQHGYVLFGGRLVFSGPYLFFSVGERGMEEHTTGKAQDLSVPNGKIHRVFWDGRIPPDNPFVHTAGAFPSIWAYGVRNPQGLAIDPRTGALWESEHGPRGGDELNHIERGKNYGWPVITYGMNYDGTPVSAKVAAPGMEQPVMHWTPSIAPSEIEFYRGDKFPRWKNQLFLGTLATQKLLRLVIRDGRVTHTEELFKGLGRIRDIKTGPDGLLYLAIESIGRPGRVVKLVPAD